MPTYKQDGGRLTIRGDLEESNEPELRKHCIALVLSEADVVELDLKEVDSITSRCLGTLVTLWLDLCASGRRLKIMPSETVQKTLDLSGLTAVFEKAAGD